MFRYCSARRQHLDDPAVGIGLASARIDHGRGERSPVVLGEVDVPHGLVDPLGRPGRRFAYAEPETCQYPGRREVSLSSVEGAALAHLDEAFALQLVQELRRGVLVDVKSLRQLADTQT